MDCFIKNYQVTLSDGGVCYLAADRVETLPRDLVFFAKDRIVRILQRRNIAWVDEIDVNRAIPVDLDDPMA